MKSQWADYAIQAHATYQGKGTQWSQLTEPLLNDPGSKSGYWCV